MLARPLLSAAAALRRPLYPHDYSAMAAPTSGGRIHLDSSGNQTSSLKLSISQYSWRCGPISKAAIYAPPRLDLLVEGTMNSLIKRFCLAVVLVLVGVSPTLANQPPGPGVSLPQILMLPLMALLTAVGGAYSILRAEKKSRLGRAGKSVAVAVLFLLGFMHEFASMLVTCVFGAIAIYRGVRMVRWGWKPAASAPMTDSGPRGWRLTRAGVALCVVALFLTGSAVVFVGYWPDL